MRTEITLTTFWDSWLIPKFQLSNKPSANLSIADIAEDDIKFALQARDAYILGTLFGARYMTTGQIARAFWPEAVKSEDLSRRRMKKLFEYGFVARMRPRTMPGTGTLPYLWTPTGKGIELLAKSEIDLAKRLQVRRYAKESFLLPSTFTILHSLIVSDFGSLCLSRGGSWYFEQESESILTVPKKAGSNEYDSQYPDAVLSWNDRDTWYLEIERSARLESFKNKLYFWRRLRANLAARNQLAGKKIVIVGRTKDSTSRDERSILPLARLLSKDTELTNFVFFLPLPGDGHTVFTPIPISAESLLATYDLKQN